LLEKTLITQIQTTSSKTESSSKRRYNIEWISNLKRNNLTYQKNVNQILIASAKNNEKIFIQYPGKESVRTNDKCRPWDFFPKLLSTNTYGNDLDFKSIWDILFSGLQRLISNDIKWSSILAIIFYRMAFMNDHIKIDNKFDTMIRKISYNDQDEEIIKNIKNINIKPFYLYSPPKKIVDKISQIVPLWGNMSFEAFLHYNDLLAWNEDCKYYYRMQQDKKKNWIGDTGRINTLLTHLSIIGYVANEISFSDVCIKFARGKGVAPITKDELFQICNGYLTK
jgi:DNA-dependent RNA polymerase auxiliary subunit epsilon